MDKGLKTALIIVGSIIVVGGLGWLGYYIYTKIKASNDAAQLKLDKAAKTNTIHANKAARKKSQLSKKVASI